MVDQMVIRTQHTHVHVAKIHDSSHACYLLLNRSSPIDFLCAIKKRTIRLQFEMSNNNYCRCKSAA